MNPSLHAETHEVFNQVPSLDGANLYRVDLPAAGVDSPRYDGAWADERLERLRCAGRWRPDAGRLSCQREQTGVQEP